MYEENILTVERCTILEILGVKNNTLKTIIQRKQLTERLKEKGYILLETFKEGRKTFYKLKECDAVERINPNYLIIKNFNVDYNKRNNKGIYYIIKDNDIYIGSTVDFRKRFIHHWNGEKNMEHTYDLLHNGGTFNILYDMTDIEDVELIRMVENEYIQYFKEYTEFNVINHVNEATWKGKNYKQQKYKYIKIKIEEYEKALKALEEQGFEI